MKTLKLYILSICLLVALALTSCFGGGGGSCGPSSTIEVYTTDSSKSLTGLKHFTFHVGTTVRDGDFRKLEKDSRVTSSTILGLKFSGVNTIEGKFVSGTDASYLTDLVFSSSLKEIKEMVFNSSTKLTSITFNGSSAPIIDHTAFPASFTSECVFTVPSEGLSGYKADNSLGPWLASGTNGILKVKTTVTVNGKKVAVTTHEKIEAPFSTPTKLGFTFTGYFTDAECKTTLTDVNGNVLCNVTSFTDSDGNWLYEQAFTPYVGWKENSYTIVFDKNASDATGETSSTVLNYTSPLTLTAGNFARVGFKVTGWKTSTATNAKLYNVGQSVSKLSAVDGSTVTLYANWVAKKAIIKLDANKTNNPTLGTVSLRTASYTVSGGVAPTLCVPTCTGFTFGGWYKETSCTTLVATTTGTVLSNITSLTDGDNKWIYDDEVTLYAKWTENSYTVVFDKNASDATGETSSTVLNYTSPLTLTAGNFARVGYKVTGWKTSTATNAKLYNVGQSVSKLSAVDGSTVTLYANWTAKKAVVKLDTNKTNNPTLGSVSLKTSQYTVTGGVASTLCVPTCQGFTFGGWYKEAECTTLVADTTGTVLSNITSLTDGDNKWIYDDEVTLYAKWTENSYTVVFDKNASDATGATSQTVLYTQEVELTSMSDVFTRAGYTLTGWKVGSPSATTKAADKGVKVSKLSATDGATVTLYANWTAQETPYTVRYYLQTLDGSYVEDTTRTDVSKSAKAGSRVTFTATNAAKIDHFKFNQSLSTYTDLIKGDGKTVFSLYYDRVQYTITWADVDGKGAKKTTKVMYEAMPECPVTPEKAPVEGKNYVFVGWDKEIVKATANVTYIAQFATEKPKFTIYFASNNETWGTVNYTSISNVEYGSKFTTSGTSLIVSATDAIYEVKATATPTDAQYNYALKSWENGTVTVTDETTVTAIFEMYENPDYTQIVESDCTVDLWYDYDGCTHRGAKADSHLGFSVAMGDTSLTNFSSTESVNSSYTLSGFYSAPTDGVLVMGADGKFVLNNSGYTDADGWKYTKTTTDRHVVLYARWN